MKSNNSVRTTVFVSMFTAMTVIGSYITIPLGPVPIALSNFFILLAGLLLGSKRGAAVAITYLLLGLLGLPVFAGGTSGLARLAGPTGGYLLGYIPAAFLAGFISEKGKKTIVTDVLALLTAALVIYVTGVPWLKLSMGITWTQALLGGMFPFLIGDAIKIAAAVLISLNLHGMAADFLKEENIE